MQLTENQQDNLYLLVQSLFEKKYTNDYTHFSFEGTRLNFDSFNYEAIFEVYSIKGSFNILIDLNENKKGIKSTFKTIKIS